MTSAAPADSRTDAPPALLEEGGKPATPWGKQRRAEAPHRAQIADLPTTGDVTDPDWPSAPMATSIDRWRW
ncbi:hypothetical protein GCM10022251_80990 [Phytohabitans flavus]|uniref:Uncharacterized protein n=1 Tax=Phytohabitans flavus TaxID=1076124 RepID=A0A6F8XLA2_9ACTN|nr:hypothetical protein [Phytohabitans flavus]BCB74561.1 hypothetical protein Pflav_009710 [Phytohabitans flavus]